MSDTQKHTKLNVPNLRFPGFEGEWESRMIGEDCSVNMCKRIFANQTSERGDVPFFKIGTIGGSPDAFISKDLFEEYKAKYNYPRKGEVMITCAGTVGKTIVFDGEDAYFQDSNIVWLSNPKQLYLNSFLNYVLSRVNWNKLNSTTITRIYNDNLRELVINYPSVKEQEKIVALLSLLDQRIAIQNKVIEKYESLIKAINQRHFKSIREDISLLTIKLSVILRERKEYCENDGTYPHASLSKEGVDRKSERYDRDFLVRDNEKKYKVTRLNDICYNPANLKFGVITRNKIGPMVFSPIYVTFEIATNYNPEYLEYYLTNPDFVRHMLKYEQGTVYERMAVSPEDFLSERIKVPSLQVQHKHATIISSISRCLSTERKIADDLLQLKRGILKQMFI